METSTVVDLVAYQPGSIVSRVLLKNPSGTVTAFAFDAGEALSEHTTPYVALLQVVEGESVVTIAGVSATVRAGQLIHLPANVPHAVKAETRFKMMLTMIKG